MHIFWNVAGMRRLLPSYMAKKPQVASIEPLSACAYALPVLPEHKIICVGLNYTDHAKEGGQPIPEHPVFFSRFITSFVPHEAPVVVPKASYKFDYEAELTIVIGKTLRYANEAEALHGIAGYTIGMDGSIRDFQKRHSQWMLGKNFDDTGSLGPYIVAASTLPDQAQGLAVQTRLNGTLLQNGNTADMIFPPARLVSELSQAMTLQPGDMILTGTPAGVGFARDPFIYLKAGDVLETIIESIATLKNTVSA